MGLGFFPRAEFLFFAHIKLGFCFHSVKTRIFFSAKQKPVFLNSVF